MQLNGSSHLRSLSWQGATVVGFGKHFTWLYVGYGHKEIVGSFAPTPPGKPYVEFDDSETDTKFPDESLTVALSLIS